MLERSTHPSVDQNIANEQESDMKYEMVDKDQTICRLDSILELRTEVRDNMHSELTDIFATHSFVGVVDVRRRVVAIQGGVKLYLVDYGMICNEYFYQLGLTDFGNFGSIRFNTPLDLTELLKVGAEQEYQRATLEEATNTDWDEVVKMVRDRLIDRKAMLADCFSLEITAEGKLLGLPLLVKGYMPSLAKLPNFLLRLGPFVDWETEKQCFHSFLRELASFYVPEAVPPAPTSNLTVGEGDAEESMEIDEDPDIAARRIHIEHALEYVLFPAFKSRLVGTKGMLKGVTEIANLKGLYRVFERC
jgi:DNA mismatch repair protein MLH1